MVIYPDDCVSSSKGLRKMTIVTSGFFDWRRLSIGIEIMGRFLDDYIKTI